MIASSSAANNASKFIINIIKLRHYPIFKQLQFEEALLRTETRPNHAWVLLNEGTPAPRIIMGSSGKADELLHFDNVHVDLLPVVRRFTGGGTVLVDHNTMFASIIGSHEFLKAFSMVDFHDPKKKWHQPYPVDIMHWTAEFYRPLFHPDLQFDLLENDYIFKNAKTSEMGEPLMAKFGGNAQYLTGGIHKRFCHHTSFLWHHDPSKMERYLALPSKRPKYRESRGHGSFLTDLQQVNWTIPDNYLGVKSVGYNPFLSSIIHRIYTLCNTEWSHSVSDIQEYFNENKFNELKDEVLSRENKLKRNSYFYHPNPEFQNRFDLNDLD